MLESVIDCVNKIAVKLFFNPAVEKQTDRYCQAECDQAKKTHQTPL
jgi:hypothetical protein